MTTFVKENEKFKRHMRKIWEECYGNSEYMYMRNYVKYSKSLTYWFISASFATRQRTPLFTLHFPVTGSGGVRLI